jgi:predicted Zn-dependent protease
MLETRIRDLLRKTRDYARSQGISAEMSFHREHSDLIRIGNSAVALATSENLTRLDMSVTEGRRSGAFSLTADIVSADQLRDVLTRAQEYCRASPEKDYDPLFGQVETPVDDSSGFDTVLEKIAPETKAGFCAQIVKAVKPRGDYDFSGSWSTGATEMYYLTTANDNEAYRRLTDGRLVMVLKEQNKKWELSVEQGGKGFAAFSAPAAIAEFEKLLPVYEKNLPFAAPLGRQRVMFGTQAISEIVLFASYYGFSGRSWEEKQSFTANSKFGDRIFSEQVTIVDDPADPNVFGMPFDFMGKKRGRFPLVQKGCFQGLMYDSTTAARYKKPQTGHDVYSYDLVLSPGNGPAEFAAGKKLAGDALYIPHLHYVRVQTPTEGMLTGSSRFNAQRLQGGEFTAPLLSTRVTEPIPQILSNIVAISARSVMYNNSATYGRRSPSAISVPEYMICDNVRISDVAESF